MQSNSLNVKHERLSNLDVCKEASQTVIYLTKPAMSTISKKAGTSLLGL